MRWRMEGRRIQERKNVKLRFSRIHMQQKTLNKRAKRWREGEKDRTMIIEEGRRKGGGKEEKGQKGVWKGEGGSGDSLEWLISLAYTHTLKPSSGARCYQAESMVYSQSNHAWKHSLNTSS